MAEVEELDKSCDEDTVTAIEQSHAGYVNSSNTFNSNYFQSTNWKYNLVLCIM